jgi:N-acetylglucosaminyl-diphospho-decaprenol L-rhamnosyltransferase
LSATLRAEPRLSILIVNYNGGALLDRCLQSLRDAAPACAVETILVDNASADGSGERAAKDFPEVHVVRNAENVGLSKAFNQALAQARGEFLLSLDNDTRVQPGALQGMMDALADRRVGAAGGMLLNPDGTPQKTARNFPSALNAVFGRRSLVTRLWPGNPVSRRYLMEAELEKGTEPYSVGWVSTAALMVRRDVVDVAGGLDEGFFVYWTDADWCARIRDAGYDIRAVPAARVIHDENLKGKRRARRSTRMVIDFHKGAYRYYWKHRAASRWSPMALVALVGLSARAGALIAWDYLQALRPARG